MSMRNIPDPSSPFPFIVGGWGAVRSTSTVTFDGGGWWVRVWFWVGRCAKRGIFDRRGAGVSCGLVFVVWFWGGVGGVGWWS